MEFFDQVPKNWYAIRPSLIGSDYNRYEIIEQDSRNIYAFLKSPCIGMEGCDRCSGPHRKKNKKCSKNLNKQPFIKSPGTFQGGIYLFWFFILLYLSNIFLGETFNLPTVVESILI